tara:strand:- start:12029 stop:12400 length:372 start_codon:yes stop_codon:yes gene_type:complete
MKKQPFCNEENNNHNISAKIKAVENSDYKLEFKVIRYDTDMIKHLNNIRYLQRAVELVPKEIIDNYYLYFIEGRFIAEAQYVQAIVSLTKNDTKDKSFIYSIKIKGTDKVFTITKTIWKKMKT